MEKMYTLDPLKKPGISRVWEDEEVGSMKMASIDCLPNRHPTTPPPGAAEWEARTVFCDVTILDDRPDARLPQRANAFQRRETIPRDRASSRALDTPSALP